MTNFASWTSSQCGLHSPPLAALLCPGGFFFFFRLKALAAFYRYLLSVLCWSTQSGSWEAVIMQAQAWSGHRWSKLHSLVDWKSFQSCSPQKCRLDWQLLKCLPMLKIEALLFLFSQLREFWIPRKATKLLIYYKVWFFLSSNINSILYPHDFSSFSSKPCCCLLFLFSSSGLVGLLFCNSRLMGCHSKKYDILNALAHSFIYLVFTI